MGDPLAKRAAIRSIAMRAIIYFAIVAVLVCVSGDSATDGADLHDQLVPETTAASSEVVNAGEELLQLMSSVNSAADEAAFQAAESAQRFATRRSELEHDIAHSKAKNVNSEARNPTYGWWNINELQLMQV